MKKLLLLLTVLSLIISASLVNVIAKDSGTDPDAYKSTDLTVFEFHTEEKFDFSQYGETFPLDMNGITVEKVVLDNGYDAFEKEYEYVIKVSQSDIAEGTRSVIEKIKEINGIKDASIYNLWLDYHSVSRYYPCIDGKIIKDDKAYETKLLVQIRFRMEIDETENFTRVHESDEDHMRFFEENGYMEFYYDVSDEYDDYYYEEVYGFWEPAGTMCERLNEIKGFTVTYIEAEHPLEGYVAGDINGDGEITPRDFALAKMAYFGLCELDEYEHFRGDLNKDGYIDTYDFAQIKMMYFGLV